MKISPTAVAKVIYTQPKNDHKGLISLIPDEDDREIPIERCAQLQLCTDPNDQDNSTKYKINGRTLHGDESLDQLVRWRVEMQRILNGLGATTYAQKKPIVEMLMVSTPLANFGTKLASLKQETWDQRRLEEDDDEAAQAIHDAGLEVAENMLDEHIGRAIDDTLKQLMPHRVLPRVRRFVRRECRKPADMKVRRFYHHMQRINNEILPNLPPFEAGQKFNNEELLDILLFATPKSWQREMERQGFDPISHELAPVVDFMERIELTEDFDANKTTVKKESKKDSKKKSKKDDKSGNKKQQYHCSHHGPNNTHNSDGCFVLHPELKEKKSNNKTWSRKANSETQKSKGELAAFIAKEVQKGLKKELAAVSKKRKSDSDSEDGEICAFDLKDFDYTKMESLKIDDDNTDFSV